MTLTHSGAVQDTNDEEFAAVVLRSDRPVLVEFTADWCGPCRMIAPVLDQIAAEETDRLRIVTIDVDQNPTTAMTYGVMGMPTLALFVDGAVATRFTGARPKAAILREIEPHLASRT